MTSTVSTNKFCTPPSSTLKNKALKGNLSHSNPRPIDPMKLPSTSQYKSNYPQMKSQEAKLMPQIWVPSLKSSKMSSKSKSKKCRKNDSYE